MLLRAFCHARGVTTTDHRGRSRSFSYPAASAPPRSIKSRATRHSESECERAWRQGERHPALDANDRIVAVLPADFTLPAP